MRTILALFASAALLTISSNAQISRQRQPISNTPQKTSSKAPFKNIFRTSLEEQSLKGKVRFIYELNYLATKNVKTNKPIPDSTTMELHLRYFDEAGNCVVDSVGALNSTEYEITKYKYAKPGQLIEETNNYGTSYNYEYDENGFITKETVYSSGSEPSREIKFREYEFINANNYNYKILRADRKKVLSCHRVSIFPDGRLKMYSNGCDTSNYNLKHVYTYASNHKHLLRYDAYSTGGELSSHTEYDNKGNEIKYVCDYCSQDASGKIKTFEYPSYDAAGNWTKKISITDNNRGLLKITERNIKYY